LTDSGRRTHNVVTRQSISLAQDKESPPARIDVLTTMLRHQLVVAVVVVVLVVVVGVVVVV